MTDLETAVVLLHKNKPEESQEMSLACARIFEAREFTVEKSQALIIAARAAAELGYYDQASDLVHSTLIEAQNQVVPALIYQCHYLLGSLALARGDQQQARVEYDHAVQELERLRGQLMIEFRAAFLEDKQTVYEELVQLCLLLDAPHEGLAYAERAKSRALVELLAFRIDLSIEVRSETDRPLIQELQQLQAERNRLYRRWETSEDTNERGKTTILPTGQKLAQQDIVTLEKEITERWHKLLIRNADYAQDAALWQVHTGPVRPVLDTGTVLIEYFVAQHQLIAFVVADHMVQAYRLDVRVVPKSSPARHPSLVENAQGILTQLYQHLVAPLRDSIQQSQKLIIVPHGSLHYLPFHAMYDGADYLLSQFEISYLPSSSLMNQTRAPRPVSDLVAVGHAYDGRLPYTALEAMAIAARWQGRCLLEEEATLTNVRAAAAQARILHLATHAVFRPDNPLFSGLALADGWLTTLDIFGLRLQASLVTLSACQTGRSVIGGGDELLGLMRAFMAAGAASIVLTLWAVEDRSTAVLMERFYAHLAAGKAKGAALRQAQLACIHGEEMDDATGREALRHPYFWAPFYLVGDAGFL
jgi:CHAT domain-containing protein